MLAFVIIRCNVTKEDLSVELKGKSEHGPCRVWTQLLDRHDGSFIVRYKMFQYCDEMEIHITSRGKHIAESPYICEGRVYSESCECPLESLDEMIDLYQCSTDSHQMEHDLNQFQDVVDFNQILKEAIRRFNHAGSYSFCHYVILNNQVSSLGFSGFISSYISL